MSKGEITVDKRPDAIRPEPSNKLSEEERQTILNTCNEPEYANLPPSQIVPTLLDEGIYHASESSYYRVLKAADQLHHRGRSQAPKNVGKPTSYTACKANELWSWDITYLASTVKGQFYYQTMKAKMEELGVLPSYSRPRVSDDNPYSEALFRTLKYRPEWPSSGFISLEAARDWVQTFVDWYNNKHRHSKINFVTPAQRHRGEDKAILASRKLVLEKAKKANPLRWSREVRNCQPAGPVSLNPEKESINSEQQNVA